MHLLSADAGKGATTLVTTYTNALAAAHNARVGSSLRAAATAMESYAATHGGYPTTLSATTYTDGPGVHVQLVSADASGFCLSGSLAAGPPLLWWSSDTGDAAPTPC
jgi:Tfp pilus assembly protein PilE